MSYLVEFHVFALFFDALRANIDDPLAEKALSNLIDFVRAYAGRRIVLNRLETLRNVAPKILAQIPNHLYVIDVVGVWMIAYLNAHDYFQASLNYSKATLPMLLRICCAHSKQRLTSSLPLLGFNSGSRLASLLSSLLTNSVKSSCTLR